MITGRTMARSRYFASTPLSVKSSSSRISDITTPGADKDSPANGQRSSPQEDPEALWSCPPIKRSRYFRKDGSLDAVTAKVDSNCAICLEQIPSAKRAALDNCPHGFCVDCIKSWANQANTCPLCKQSFSFIRENATGRLHFAPATNKLRDDDDYYSNEEDDAVSYLSDGTDLSGFIVPNHEGLVSDLSESEDDVIPPRFQTPRMPRRSRRILVPGSE